MSKELIIYACIYIQDILLVDVDLVEVNFYSHTTYIFFYLLNIYNIDDDGR